MELTSCWSDGYRNYYYAVNIVTGEQVEVPENVGRFTCSKLPENIVLICHSYCGTEQYCTIYANADNMPKLLTECPTLSTLERDALYVIRAYKNTYGGEKDIRRRRMNLSPEQWASLLQGLKEKGLVDNRGSLTIKGRNNAPLQSSSYY